MWLGCRDLGLGSGLILLRRLGLGQISLRQSRDSNLWDSQMPSFGTIWDSSPMGFWSSMGTIGLSWDLCPQGFWVPKVGCLKNSEIPGLSHKTRVPSSSTNLAVPKSSNGTQIPGKVWTGTKIVGTVPGFWAVGLWSLRQISSGHAVPSQAHPCPN